MRFAFGSFSAPDASLAQLLELADGYGYDGIEPRIDAQHSHGIELAADQAYRAQVRGSVEAAGQVLVCVDTSCRLADPATTDQQVETATAAIGLAADVGASRIRVFGGRLPEGVGRSDARAAFVSALRQLVEPARRRGVTVCIETHDDWSDPAESVAVMEAVDDPAVRVLWDVMHPVRQAGLSMEQSYRALAPWVEHVHIHDGSVGLERLEFRPIGAGDFDHREVLRLLGEGGYEGFVSGEWINWEPPEVHLPRELATLRGYLAELS